MGAARYEFVSNRRIFVAVLIFSGLLNVFLSLRVVSLERSKRPIPRIKVGNQLENIVGADASGVPVTIRFSESLNPTVLLILRPGCTWCEKNMPNWRTLIEAKAQNFHFVVVSLSVIDMKRYLQVNSLYAPAIAPQLGKNPTLDNLTGTPQTIVVDTDGRVRRVWFGAFTPEIKRDVEVFFGVNLPVTIQTPG